MIPMPKSEAWLICAWKKNPYQGCQALEGRSGNDKSPNSLKRELSRLLDDDVGPASLCQKIEQSFDASSVDMTSFKAFKERLEEVI